MKHITALGFLIASLVTQVVADLNFANESKDAQAYDTVCGIMIGLGVLMCIVVIFVDIVKET